MGFRADMAGAGVLKHPRGEIAFESIDGGLEHAHVGVDAAQVEVGPTALVDEMGAFGREQRVDALVEHGGLGTDVRRQLVDQVGLRTVDHPGPAHQPLERAAGVVPVPAEHHVTMGGLPSAHQADDDWNHGFRVLGDETVLHIHNHEHRFASVHLTSRCTLGGSPLGHVSGLAARGVERPALTRPRW